MSTPEARSDQLDERIDQVFGIRTRRFVELAMGVIIIALVVTLTAMYLILRSISNTNQTILKDIDKVLTNSCQSIEALKTTQRNLAIATIEGDKALLGANPNGIPGFPADTIKKDIADKQRAVNELTPRPC